MFDLLFLKYICVLCKNRVLIPSYTKLRGHLRVQHGVKDRDFVFDRDEPQFRHPFLYRADDQAVQFSNNNPGYGMLLPTDEFLQVFGSAVADAIDIGECHDIV